MDEQRSNQPRSDYEANNQLEALRLIQEELWTTLRSEDDPDIRMALLARFAENRDTIADLTSRAACSSGQRQSKAVAALAGPRPVAAVALSSIAQPSVTQSSVATLEAPAVAPTADVDESDCREAVIDLRDFAAGSDEVSSADLDHAICTDDVILDDDEDFALDLEDDEDVALDLEDDELAVLDDEHAALLFEDGDSPTNTVVADEADLAEETLDPDPLPMAARSTNSDHYRLYELGTVALSHKPPSVLDDLEAFMDSHAAVDVLQPVARDRRGVQRLDELGPPGLVATMPPPPTAEAWIAPPRSPRRTTAGVGRKATPSPLAHDEMPRKVILFMGGALAVVGMGWIYFSPDASTASGSAQGLSAANAEQTVDQAATSAVVDEISAVLQGVGLKQVVVADGDGVVHLSGAVASTGQRDAAIGVAEALRGEGLVEASALLVVAEGGDAAPSLVVASL